MPVPVLNYSTPRDDDAIRRKHQDQSWYARGVVYSFSGMAGVLVIVAYMLGQGRVGDSVAAFLCGLALLRFAERKVRRQHNSSAFATGAFIGGLLPGALILICLAAAIAKF